MALSFISPNSARSARVYDEATISRQATMLANRLKKNFKHLSPQFKKRQIDVFRLYNWDIPEIRAVIDWYAGHLVVGEYVREQTKGTNWLEAMAAAAAEALGIPAEQVHLRRRNTRPKEGERYQRLAREAEPLVVHEGELQFWVDLDSYLDTGLFADHRETRRMLGEQSEGRHFLNLYAYTGSFTVAAARAGAASTTSVDLSGRYLAWAEANLRLNGIEAGPHRFVATDVRGFLREAAAAGRTWDLIFLDPPSFSTREGLRDFDVLRDHPYLLREAVKVLAPQGVLYFSTNHQRFEPRFTQLEDLAIEEITAATVPLDYKARVPHRCFRVTHAKL